MRNGPRSRKRGGHGLARGRRAWIRQEVAPGGLTGIGYGREGELVGPLGRQEEYLHRNIDARKAIPERAERKSDLVAVIDAGKCILCGRCADVCPTGAITVDSVVNIDIEKCLGCGRCVSECPQKAIIIKRI